MAKRATRNPTAAKDVGSNVSKFPDKMLVERWNKAPAPAARVDIARQKYTCNRYICNGVPLMSREEMLPHQKYDKAYVYDKAFNLQHSDET